MSNSSLLLIYNYISSLNYNCRNILINNRHPLETSPHLLEVVPNLELVLGVGHVGLDLAVSVVDDGQEHVDQHEEHEEHEQHEEDGPQDAVSLLQLVEVKVSQDDAEQCEAGGN